MARVTDEEVKSIISLNVLTDTTPFIGTAHVFVNEYLLSSGQSEDVLKEIEKYIAAHLVALHPDERQLESQKIGEAEDKYSGDFGKLLDFTQYGQFAKSLDASGILVNIGKTKAAISVISIDNGY